MISIVIADDHEIIRNGLVHLIDAHMNMQVDGEAESLAGLMQLLADNRYDMLILDLNLGDCNGLETIKQVNQTYPNLPILILSMYSEDSYGVRAIRAGASGYLNKSVISSELTRAITQVSAGKKYISDALSENIEYGTSLEKCNTEALETLSKREFEIFSLISVGRTPKEIAAELQISPKTVSTYQSRILEKLNLSNTAQLLRYAIEQGVVSH